MANNSPTIVAASLSDDQLKKSIDSLVTHVDEAMKKMVQSTNNAVGEMEAKLKSLGNVRISSGGTTDGGSSRRTSAVEKETKARKELNMTLDQQAAALEKASGKKKGIEYTTIPSDIDKSLTYLVNTNKDVDAQMSAIIQKEQALIDAKQREAQITEQIASAQRAANSVRGVSAYDLGIDPNVSAGRQRQIASTRAASKETEYLRQQVASLLEVEEREIKTANTTSSSYAQLAQYLKNLQSAYQRLGADRIAKGEGTDLANEIQRTQRAMQKLQQTMSRPVSLKDALGGSDKTLDDIAYKIRRLQSYMQGLDATNKKSAEEFKRAALNVEILKNKQNELLAKNAQLIGSNNSLIRSNTALGRSWNYMKNRLAFYFTVGASTQFVKNLIEIRSQYEMTERALGILVNSAERGTQIFNELSQMALVSPYTLIELSGAAKQLVAYDVAAKDVVDTTRRLADMASAVGVPMERLTYALGQIKAYGYLNSRDNRMFANAGIPLVKQLADYYTELEGKLVSTADVYDRIKKKAVGYADVMQVITKMTDEGGKFFDFQEKMSGTLKVQIANLTLAWNNMLNEIGASEQGVLTTGIAALKNLFLAWKDLSNILTTVAAIFGIVKAQQILSNIAIGKSTVSLIGYINANKEATWVEYSRALQTKKLTATQAAWLLVTNKSNAALAASLVRLKIIDAATARYLTTMKGLSAGLLQMRIIGTMALSGLAKGVKALGAAFMTNLPLVALTAAIDLFTHFSSVASNNKSFNESIANGANEAAKALENFTKEEDKVQARAKAASGSLSDTEAKKVWEAIREQIELSSQAANIFIPQLLSITNINERVTAAFSLADKIQEATNKLGELRDEMEVSQDSWLWGLFGEGIGEDLDDYNKRVKELREQAKYFAEGETSVWEDLKIAINGVWDGIGGGSGSQSAKEAVREIEKFANNAADVIKEKLGKEGVLDEKQVTEAVARFVKAAEQQIPEIRGAGKKLFEALTNDIMGKQFEVFNAQEYYYSAFLEQLKKDYGSKFADITEDIKNKTVVWSDAQKKAIKETADKVKKDWPQASRDAIDEILKDLNNTEFKLHLVATFSSDLTDFQQQFRDRANNLGVVVAGTLEKFSPQSGDDLPSWTKKQQESIKALREENKTYEKDSSDWAKQRIAANNSEIEGRTKALSLFKQSAISDKDAAKNKKQAETELQKALKDELSTIEKVRSIYKDLTKEGMSHADAVERATRGWDETVDAINRVLQKNGLQKLDLSKFAGIENPRELLNTLQSQLEELVKRGASTSEIRVLQAKIQTVSVDADKYDLTKITKGLNNELGKLKDEYELAVELDANPELGGVFMDMMGISEEQLKNLPKDFEGVMVRLQSIIDHTLGSNRFNLAKNLSKSAIDQWLKINKHGNEQDDALAKMLNTFREYANKVRLDETKKQVEEWNKLLEKYAEYEYKRKQIFDEYNREMEVARKKGAGQDITNAIENRRDERLADLDFEKFRKSPEWITATGNLAGMTTRAIGLLIDKLNEYKRTAKNLSPKQIKELNKALNNLYKEQRKNNPFKAIANMLDEAKDRMATFDDAIAEVEEQIQKAEDAVNDAYEAGEDASKPMSVLAKLKEKWKNLKEEQQKAGEIDASSWVSAINETVGAVQSAIGVFNDLAKAISGVDNSDLDKVFSVVEKAGQFASMGAAFGGYGAIIGAVVGAGVGIANVIQQLDDERINNKIKDSETAVKRLENQVEKLTNAYDALDDVAEHAYGTQRTSAELTMQANQKLQLQMYEMMLIEKRRQLSLEKSRSSKSRDAARIADLEGEIISLQGTIDSLVRDVTHAIEEISDSLLGISRGSWAEELTSAMIHAFRTGEDYMKVFEESWDDMVENMIMKLIVQRFIGDYMDKYVFGEIDKIVKNRTERYSNETANATNALRDWQRMNWSDVMDAVNKHQDDSYIQQVMKSLGIWDAYQSIIEAGRQAQTSEEGIEAYNAKVSFFATYGDAIKNGLINLYGNWLDATETSLEDATWRATDEAYKSILGNPATKEGAKNLAEDLKQYMDLYDINFGQKQLSALQQGISGITEDTAGALEGITNGISQQSYLQSDLLTQIRDTILGFDLDIQMGVLSGILLQLQSSYQIQMSIRDTLQGWSNASGMAVRVEMI